MERISLEDSVKKEEETRRVREDRNIFRRKVRCLLKHVHEGKTEYRSDGKMRKKM
jgi:hypothetical protein